MGLNQGWTPGTCRRLAAVPLAGSRSQLAALRRAGCQWVCVARLLGRCSWVVGCCLNARVEQHQRGACAGGQREQWRERCLSRTLAATSCGPSSQEHRLASGGRLQVVGRFRPGGTRCIRQHSTPQAALSSAAFSLRHAALVSCPQRTKGQEQLMRPACHSPRPHLTVTTTRVTLNTTHRA